MNARDIGTLGRLGKAEVIGSLGRALTGLYEYTYPHWYAATNVLCQTAAIARQDVSTVNRFIVTNVLRHTGSVERRL